MSVSAAPATETVLLFHSAVLEQILLTIKQKKLGSIRPDYGCICCETFSSFPECLCTFLGAKVKKVEDSVKNSYILNQSKPIQ